MSNRKHRTDYTLTSHMAGGSSHGSRYLTAANGDSLTQSVPLLYDANGNVISTATRSGNTTQFVTHDAGTKTAGNVPEYDANGNLTDSGSTAGGGGGGGATIYRTTYASIPTSGLNVGDLWFTTDRGSQLSGYATSATAFAFYWGNQPVTLPPSTGWTWDNQETGDAVDFSLGSMQFIAIRTAVGEHTLQYRTAPSTPYTVDFLFYHDYSGNNSPTSQGGRDTNVGVYFRDSTGAFVSYTFGAFNNTPAIAVQYWNNNNSINNGNVISNSDNQGAALFDFLCRNPMPLRIEDDGTDLHFYWALTEGNWIEFGSGVSRTAFLGSGPTQYGVGGYKGDGTIMMNIVSIVEA